MYLIRELRRKSDESVWLMGICENGYDDLKSGCIHWINNGVYEGKKWFADPFIIKFTKKKIYLLVEEFDYKIHRGRIARLIVDRTNWTVCDCKIILDLDTHLSFPMIWRENNHIYICPENCKSGAWHIYEYDEEEEKMTYIQPLIKEKLTDAILYKNKKGYYILSTYEPTPNGRCLSIYHSDTLLGKYKQTDTIVFGENVARNAGIMFTYNGDLIRPAQECTHTYGHAISFQRVIENDNKWTFEEIYKFFSPHPQYYLGTHTYNEYQGMAVIDVKRKKNPLFGRFFDSLQNLAIKAHLKKRYVLK